MTNRFLRYREVENLTGLPTSSLYDEMKVGRFPKPIKLSAARVAWLETEVAEWQQARIASSRDQRMAPDGPQKF